MRGSANSPTALPFIFGYLATLLPKISQEGVTVKTEVLEAKPAESIIEDSRKNRERGHQAASWPCSALK